MTCEEECSLVYISPGFPPTQISTLTAGLPPAAGGRRCSTLLVMPQIHEVRIVAGELQQEGIPVGLRHVGVSVGMAPLTCCVIKP